MHIFNEYSEIIRDLVDCSGCDVIVEAPKDKNFGDLTTNLAMLLAKKLKKSPIEIAGDIKSILDKDERFVGVSVAKPGFINWKMPAEKILEHLNKILTTEYGKADLGHGEKVNIEYVSANPTGPLHAGHARGAIVGDALARLLQYVGYDVTKEYYINDAGNQIKFLAQSLYFRYSQIVDPENTAKELEEHMYPGDYLIDIAQEIVSNHGNKFIGMSEDEWSPFFKDVAISKIMDNIRTDLRDMDVNHDVFTSEKILVENGHVDKCIKYLEDKGLVYYGVLPKPKGKLLEDWEEREQLLFKSTEFGDTTDRPLKKSDGTWTYFATDIAYHFDKYNRGFKDMVDFWGADHGGYIKRMTAATEAVTQGNGKLSVKICQLVKFVENGKEVKMSKRAGTFITVRDILDKVGKDIIRFIMLSRKDDATLEFDFAKVIEQSRENPVFYVQYALARTYSVVRQYVEVFGDYQLKDADYQYIKSDEEFALLKTLMEWPLQVELAAKHKEPHRITFYLSSVAAAFHALWNAGKADYQLRFIDKDDKSASLCRLALVIATQTILESGLNIIGVTPLKELR